MAGEPLKVHLNGKPFVMMLLNVHANDFKQIGGKSVKNAGKQQMMSSVN